MTVYTVVYENDLHNYQGEEQCTTKREAEEQVKAWKEEHPEWSAYYIKEEQNQ
jgi:hypothetical protein